MNFSILKFPVSAFIALLAVQTSQAGVIFHTNKASFDAVATTSVFSDFEGIVTDTGNASGNPFIVDNVKYRQTNGLSATVCGANACNGNPFNSALMVSSNSNPLEIDMNGLASPVLGVGGIFGDTNSGPSAATLRIFGVGNILLDTQNVQVADLGAGLVHTFFGWTATGSDVFTRIEFDITGDFEAVDDMQFAFSVSPVPEPTTLALTGLGLIIVGFSRRKNH